jgi:hypothetical protein
MNQAAGCSASSGQDHAARRATGAEQQDALAGQCTAKIVRQVAHQAGTVGIVANNAGGIGEQQRIDRAGPRRPRGERVSPGERPLP